MNHESTGSGFASQHKLCFSTFYTKIFTFYSGCLTKDLPILEKNIELFGQNLFWKNTPIKSTETTSSGFESQRKLYVLAF